MMLLRCSKASVNKYSGKRTCFHFSGFFPGIGVVQKLIISFQFESLRLQSFLEHCIYCLFSVGEVSPEENPGEQERWLEESLNSLSQFKRCHQGRITPSNKIEMDRQGERCFVS